MITEFQAKLQNLLFEMAELFLILRKVIGLLKHSWLGQKQPKSKKTVKLLINAGSQINASL